MKPAWNIQCNVATAIRNAFTLIELLVSMTVLLFIITVVAVMSNSTARLWSNGEQTVENYQTGRVLLEMMAREVSQAVISSKSQFVHDPILPPEANQHASSSIFWVAPLSSTSSGDLCEVGYYLTNSFELKRFFVPPADAVNYGILTSTPTDYSPRPTGSHGGVNDHANAALWVTDFVAKTVTDASGHFRPLSSTVSGGVLNFFVRCLDVNGDPIPWLDTGLKYNSAEPMQPATPGLRSSTTINQTNPSSFIYTYFNAANLSDTKNTVSANILPCAIELTLITTDMKSLQRLGANAVPTTPVVAASYLQRSSYLPNVLPDAPLAIPANIALFVKGAQAAGFHKVHLFSTVVSLHNAAR